jgi:hypothetical protein
MSDLAAMLAHPVTDAEIEGAAVKLGLRPRSFHGDGGDDPRLDVLRNNGSIDIAACPGSGKTTLLVAKLAILARRWTLPRQGMCVLSHTNVARIEIENRLGGDAATRAVLGYPHFVGTIHGFVNHFVAMPWLRSQGIPVAVIDDDLCVARRWNKLSRATRTVAENARRDATFLRIKDVEHDLGDLKWGKGTLGKNKPLYKTFVEACRAATNDGYFCHDDMLLWAGQAIAQCPGLRDAARQRFPLLFLDEVQDNSEAQSVLLWHIFTEGDGAVVRQRFGDMNQAIYGRPRDAQDAESDPFPDAAVTIAIPNSHRFGAQIAAVADPLALNPPGLVGLREHRPDEAGQQAMLLLFDPAVPAGVLPAFARLLIERFEPALRSKAAFAAIGSAHRDTGRDNPPNCVAHYWPGYDARLAKREAKPNRMIAYLRRGIAEARPSGDIHPIVERTADGLLHLASVLNPAVRHPKRINRHRQLLALLAHDPALAQRYRVLCMLLANNMLPQGPDLWRKWSQPLVDIASGLLGEAEAGEADEFLGWEATLTKQVAADRPGNVFNYPADAPEVRINVGSIHSVKGETHHATLVLDTHFRGSHLGRIKPWLTGEKSGLAAGRRYGELRRSLKQHYVAVTRPSHLLCIAMRLDEVTDAELALMRARQWRVGQIVNEAIEWHE